MFNHIALMRLSELEPRCAWTTTTIAAAVVLSYSLLSFIGF